MGGGGGGRVSEEQCECIRGISLPEGRLIRLVKDQMEDNVKVLEGLVKFEKKILN